jgi:dihydroorotate dehydrogenase (fumarate)
VNLATPYLGLTLETPLVVGASPFCDHTGTARQLQDAGAGAIVMRSLFEEQILAEQRALVHHLEAGAEATAEATSYFPAHPEYLLSPDLYLRQLEHLKSSLSIPVIASLNGCRPGGWTAYARRFAAAGADAIELNLYHLSTRPDAGAAEIEAELLETVASVTRSVTIPVAVKLSPFHTAPAHFAAGLEAAGARGIVVFNRFYQPDFNLEELEVTPSLRLSDSSELLLRLRWLAVLSPQVRGSLAVSGGVHTVEDILKALLAGAHAVQVVSVLLRHGPRVLATLLAALRLWLTDHGYEDLRQLRGALDLRRCPDPTAFERANYIRILQTWRI